MNGHVKAFVDLVVIILKMTCFSFAGYMIYLQFSSYVRNEDSTSLSYEVFQDDKNPYYPIFSICLFGSEEHLFTGSTNVCPPCTNETFRNEECITDYCQAHEYFETLTGKRDDKFNFISVAFNEKAYSIYEDIQFFHVTTELGKKVVKMKNWVNQFSLSPKKQSATPLDISYQDSSIRCFTKKEDDMTGQRLAYEHIKIDVQRFVVGHTAALKQPDIQIFIHQKHQLIRKLRTPTVWIRMDDLKDAAENFKDGFIQKVDLRIDNVEVLKKRKNSKKPCNETLFDEDKKWIETAIMSLRCIPPFFKRFLSSSSSSIKELARNSCKKHHLSMFRNTHSPNRYFEEIAEKYLQPCGQMISSVASTEALMPKVFPSKWTDELMLKNRRKTYEVDIGIRYGLTTYKVATNNQAFTFLSLFSQIGGFVGIFLGFSLLQLTVLLKTLLYSFFD